MISFDRGAGMEARLASRRAPGIVSFVGGGGKSTLIYSLAEALARQGKRILVTTSTHIYAPNPEYRGNTVQEVLGLWEAGKFAVLGAPAGKKGKLTQPEASVLEALKPMADLLLVEADGAKGRPVKVPRDKEPVIWPDTDLVVCVMGLSAIGQPWQVCGFGAAWKDADILTEADAARLLSSEAGGRKAVHSREFWVVLNQCDDENRQASAQRMAQMLMAQGVPSVFAASFDPRERAYYHSLANAEAVL